MDTTNQQFSDETLIKAVADGDEAAFADLVRRYEQRILNLAYRYVNSAAEAEDIAADVFFKTWKHAADFRRNAKFSTWIYRIAVNTCLNYRRDKAASSFRTDSLDKPVPTEDGELPREIAEPAAYQPEHALQNAERRAAVRRALDALAPQQKIAFMLCHFEGKAYREIAEIMGISVSAVESLLFRAKENIRKALVTDKK
jgi:RNA polymerase sigma-70 factor (ECF subfamily)